MKALLILMMGAFVSQTTEFLPIGLLPQLESDLQISPDLVGYLVTGYAWVITLTSIPLTLLTRKFERRSLFLFLLGTITISNGLAVICHSYQMLIVLRLIAALGHGVFWAMLAAYAIRVAPNMPNSRATAIVFAGISMASVMGIPIASFIGEKFSWQIGFGLFGLLGLCTFAAAILWLPSFKNPVIMDAKETKGSALPRNNKPLYGAALTTLIVIGMHFTSYTYITTLLDSPMNMTTSEKPMMLLIFGVAGVVGMLLAGWLGSKPLRLAVVATCGILVSQIMITQSGMMPYQAMLEVFIWGLSISVLIVGLQGWFLLLSPKFPEAASALLVTSFNLGIGSGALAGGMILTKSGNMAVLYLAIGLGVLGLVSFSLAERLNRKQND
ncbi:MFS transporter [Serratia sp. D1N4]